MQLIFLDTETTGLNPEKHRTIEIAFQISDPFAARTLAAYEAVISQPREIWDEADPQSLLVNGMDWEKNLQGKSEQVVAAEITSYFQKANILRRGAVFVCQNPSFDRTFFSQIIHPDLQEEYHWPYHWLDLASMYWIRRAREEREFAIKVAEEGLSKDQISAYFGLPAEEQPHRAMNGVRHLMACYRAVLNG